MPKKNRIASSSKLIGDRFEDPVGGFKSCFELALVRGLYKFPLKEGVYLSADKLQDITLSALCTALSEKFPDQDSKDDFVPCTNLRALESQMALDSLGNDVGCNSIIMNLGFFLYKRSERVCKEFLKFLGNCSALSMITFAGECFDFFRDRMIEKYVFHVDEVPSRKESVSKKVSTMFRHLSLKWGDELCESDDPKKHTLHAEFIPITDQRKKMLTLDLSMADWAPFYFSCFKITVAKFYGISFYIANTDVQYNTSYPSVELQEASAKKTVNASAQSMSKS